MGKLRCRGKLTFLGSAYIGMCDPTSAAVLGGLLFEHDLRGTLAVHAEALVGHLDDGAHGLAHGVEGVHLIQLLFRHLAAHRLVVLLQVQHEAQQATLSLVAHLLGQGTLLFWGLWREVAWLVQGRTCHRGILALAIILTLMLLRG